MINKDTLLERIKYSNQWNNKECPEWVIKVIEASDNSDAKWKMENKINEQEYVLELPIISKLPVEFFDENITENTKVQEAYFGYNSYDALYRNELLIETKNGRIILRGDMIEPFQVTLKLKRVTTSEREKYIIPQFDIHSVYHPLKGDNRKAYYGNY